MKRILVVAMLVAASSSVFAQPGSSAIRFGKTLVDGGFTRADGSRDLISDVIPGGVTQGAAASVTTSAQAPPAKAARTTVTPFQESRLWEFKPSEDLKGAKGRLVVDFHDEVPMAHMLVKIYSKDGGEPLSDRKRRFDLLSGAYDVVIAGKRVTGVPIQSGQETRLLMGLLRVVYTDMSRTEVYDSDKKTLLVKDYGTLRLGLPVGKYWVKLAGRMVEIEIKDGQVVEF